MAKKTTRQIILDAWKSGKGKTSDAKITYLHKARNRAINKADAKLKNMQEGAARKKAKEKNNPTVTFGKYDVKKAEQEHKKRREEIRKATRKNVKKKTSIYDINR